VSPVWSAIAHMALTLGEAGIKQIDNAERAGLLHVSQHAGRKRPSSISREGRHWTFGDPHLLPKRDFVFGQSLAIEFITQLLQALIAVYLLSLTRIGNFAGRLGFYALVGLIAVIATNISYWNWYSFPIAYMFTGWVGLHLRRPGRRRNAGWRPQIYGRSGVIHCADRRYTWNGRRGEPGVYVYLP
jgi:hypothetical protein